MEAQDKQPAPLRYEGPHSNSVSITEDDFRDAIAFIVSVQPPERPMDGIESYDRAMAPYEADVRRANDTLKLYAARTLQADPEVMQRCFYQYAADPSFFRKDLPKSTVRSILKLAWSDIWYD